MKTKRLLQMMPPALGLASLLVSSMASAIVIPAPGAGSIRFNFAGWDEGSVGYPAGYCGGAGGAPATGNANVGSLGTGCDSLANGPAIPAKNAFSIAGLPGSPGTEDTWGVVRITAIENNGNPIYANPVGSAAGDIHLSAVFYGLADGQVNNNGSTTSTYSYGGYLDIYAVNGSDPFTRINATATGGIPSPTHHVGSDSTYAPITSTTGGFGAPTLLLRLAFAPGGDATVTDATLSGAFNNTSIGGGSASLFDVVTGVGVPAWEAAFDTNKVPGFDGLDHDFELDVGYRCAGAAIGTRCDPTNGTPNLFTLEVDGSFTGNVLPEPVTLALLGPGLAFLGFRASRRKAA